MGQGISHFQLSLWQQKTVFTRNSGDKPTKNRHFKSNLSITSAFFYCLNLARAWAHSENISTYLWSGKNVHCQNVFVASGERVDQNTWEMYQCYESMRFALLITSSFSPFEGKSQFTGWQKGICTFACEARGKHRERDYISTKRFRIAKHTTSCNDLRGIVSLFREFVFFALLQSYRRWETTFLYFWAKCEITVRGRLS